MHDLRDGELGQEFPFGQQLEKTSAKVIGNIVKKPAKVPKQRRGKKSSAKKSTVETTDPEAAHHEASTETAPDTNVEQEEYEEVGDDIVRRGGSQKASKVGADKPASGDELAAESSSDDDVEMTPREDVVRSNVCHGGDIRYCKNTDSAPLALHPCQGDCGTQVHHFCAWELEEGSHR